MKLNLTRTLLVACLALVGYSKVAAGGLVDDFRLELKWRSQYGYNDVEAAIILYEQSHYRGRSLILYPGEQIDNLDDYEWGFRIRSIEVIGPVNTVLFDETGLWGHQLEVYRDIPDLRDYRMRLNNYSSFYWHNRARSAYVTYRDPNVSISIQIGPGRILPRIFRSRPITPHYYWIPQPKRYYHPRPHWYRERPKAVPPPRPRTQTYRAPSTLPPRVTPHSRPPSNSPRAAPSGAPPNRAQGTPPKRENSSSTRPPNRQSSPTTRPPSRDTPSPAPSVRPPSRTPSSPPATRPPSPTRKAPAARPSAQNRPPAATRTESRRAPSSPPPQRTSGNRSAPPPR